MIVVQGKPDVVKPKVVPKEEGLLDLLQDDQDHGKTYQNDLALLGLDDVVQEPEVNTLAKNEVKTTLGAESLVKPSLPEIKPEIRTTLPSVDDLLNGSPVSETTSSTMSLINSLAGGANVNKTQVESKPETQKSSRQRGLEELDLLGESAIMSHLSQKSPQFVKRNEKVPMGVLQQQRAAKSNFDTDLTDSLPNATSAASLENPKPKSPEKTNGIESEISKPSPIAATEPKPKPSEIKLSDLNVDLVSIKPDPSTTPVTLQDPSDGISIVLNFGLNEPKPGVRVVVVTIMNKSPEEISDLEFKAVVPKGCKVKLQSPSGNGLPGHRPFVPPSAITQVMLIANPNKVKVSLKYVLSYLQDDESQTEMGECKELPI